MILPWLQVDEEAFERAVELAALLEVDEAQAMGHLVHLWRWALSRPADPELSGEVRGATAIVQIEAGARWRGVRGALVGALVELGLIAEEDAGRRVKGLERYRAQLEKRAQDRERKASSGTPKPSNGVPQEFQRKALGKSGQTQTQIQTQKEEQQLPLSAEQPADRAVVVFEHWRKVMRKGPRTAFDARRRRAVEARLADGYDIDDLRRAIEGCSMTPHNMGQNDRAERYDDLELICRDAAHVERFKTRAEVAGPPRDGRPDADVLAELQGLARATGDAQLPRQLAVFTWERHTGDGAPRWVGLTEDPYAAAWLSSQHGAFLAQHGIGLDAPSLPEGAAA